MAKGFLYISNGTQSKNINRFEEKTIDIGSFWGTAISAVNSLGWKIFMGINHEKPEKVKCSSYDITFYNQNSFRNPFDYKNVKKAYKNLCQFLEKHPEIEVINCNTPIGGFVGRIAGHKYKKKVIYTAHGFHFFKGASLKNWILFYPIEKFLARWTDVLITINQEDYERGKKLMKGKNTYLIPGVGVDLSAFSMDMVIRDRVRRELNLTPNDFALISMGDLIERKNYRTAIEAIAKAQRRNIKYFICGNGPQLDMLKKLAIKLRVEKQIVFMGRRNDIKQLAQGMDAFLFTSKQEGLARSLMEAMAIGLPCIVSDIRGNNDLIKQNKGGYLCNPLDSNTFAKGIQNLCDHIDLRNTMSEWNKERIKKFDVDSSKKAFLEIFSQELDF